MTVWTWSSYLFHMAKSGGCPMIWNLPCKLSEKYSTTGGHWEVINCVDREYYLLLFQFWSIVRGGLDRMNVDGILKTTWSLVLYCICWLSGVQISMLLIPDWIIEIEVLLWPQIISYSSGKNNKHRSYIRRQSLPAMFLRLARARR
jgi:hypothetical protein